VNPAIGNEFLERQPRDFTPDRVEAGYDDRVRGVIDDHIDARS
jgi:hypothetical protein